ncbi:hypothetical protein C8Q70DRAFT_995250, partial [Cubamyces menziesii]
SSPPPPEIAPTTLANAQSTCSNLVAEYRSSRTGNNTLDEENLHSLRAILDTSLMVVCELINESQPINRLPLEILCHIFSLVPDDLI